MFGSTAKKKDSTTIIAKIFVFEDNAFFVLITIVNIVISYS